MSQVILNEGFESANTPNTVTNTWDLDSGIWGVFDNGVGLANSWIATTAVTSPVSIHSGVKAAFMQRENVGQGNTSQDYLATPLITVPANGQVRFWTRLNLVGNQGTLFKIMVSTTTQDNPAAYTLVQQYTEDQLNAVFNVYEEKVVSISAYAGQQIYVAFVMEFTQTSAGIGGDRWLVDDVRVASQCIDPLNLSAGSISQSAATLGWANPSGANSWEIEIIPFASTPTGTGTIISTNPYVATSTLPGGVAFTPTTQYKYYLRAICPDNIPSNWVGPFVFIFTRTKLQCSNCDSTGSGLQYVGYNSQLF